ncbi:MAG: AbrB/MazE/SpoVT family DNA-binding domain-containing protein [Patescibacteria group bacterium]
MNYTATTTTKGQVTIPKSVRDKLRLRTGTKIDIFTFGDSFIAKPQRESRLFETIKKLKIKDKGQSFEEIRQKAQGASSAEVAEKFERLSK